MKATLVAAICAAQIALAGTALAEPVWGPDGKLQPLADGFPSDTIHVWNVQAPGHSDEAEARMLIRAAEQFSPVSLVVESGGTGPLVQWAWMERLETIPGGLEGYHTAVGAVNGIAARLITYDLDRTIEDLKSAMLVVAGYTANLLVVPADSPHQTVQDFVAFAKEHPGDLRVGTCQPGCGQHVTLEEFADAAAIAVRPIPHEGTAQSVLTLQGGGIEAAVSPPALVTQLIEEGTVKAILQWRPTRSAKFPDVPTGAELGFGTGTLRTSSFLTHPDVAEERKEWLTALFHKAYATPEMQSYFADRDIEVINLVGDEADQYVQTTYDAQLPVSVKLGLATERNAKAFKEAQKP